jgi:lipopolysaccharide export system protein LptA
MKVFAFQSGEDRLRLIHADELKQEARGEKTEQRLQGNVTFKQGRTTIKCDLATQISNEEPVALIGNVQILDQDSKLAADTVYFYQELGKQIARGDVVSITESDTTYSDEMTYLEKENKIISDGNVRIVDIDERTELRSGHAEYWREAKYGKIWENPTWLRFDSLGVETMTTSGDTMEIFETDEHIVVKNNVKIQQPNIDASCSRLEYYGAEERAVLTGEPEVLQSNQHISGDTLTLYFQDSILNHATVLGNAKAISDADTIEKGRWVNKLTGKKMNFYFEKGELHRVMIQDQATSEYHIIDDDQYKGRNEVSGDEIEVLLANGQAQRVKVASHPDFAQGKYGPPKR